MKHPAHRNSKKSRVYPLRCQDSRPPTRSYTAAAGGVAVRCCCYCVLGTRTHTRTTVPLTSGWALFLQMLEGFPLFLLNISYWDSTVFDPRSYRCVLVAGNRSRVAASGEQTVDSASQLVIFGESLQGLVVVQTESGCGCIS